MVFANTQKLSLNQSSERTGSTSSRPLPILRCAFTRRPLVSLDMPAEREHRGAGDPLTDDVCTLLGYPIATVPLGQLSYNQRPFGLCLMARDGCEEDLLRFMHLYESVTPPRPIPQRLGRA